MGLEIEFYNNFIQFRVLNFNLVTTSEKETRVQTSYINATEVYAVGSKSFRPDQLFKATEIKQICYFSTQSPFTSTHFSTDTLISPQMALYIPHSIFYLAWLLYVRPETFGLYYVFIFVPSLIQLVAHMDNINVFGTDTTTVTGKVCSYISIHSVFHSTIIFQPVIFLFFKHVTGYMFLLNEWIT